MGGEFGQGEYGTCVCVWVAAVWVVSGGRVWGAFVLGPGSGRVWWYYICVCFASGFN